MCEYLQARANITEVHFLPFNPVDKRTALTYIDGADGKWYRASKGAPEQVLLYLLCPWTFQHLLPASNLIFSLQGLCWLLQQGKRNIEKIIQLFTIKKTFFYTCFDILMFLVQHPCMIVGYHTTVIDVAFLEIGVGYEDM
jgi:hypothetical protein